MLRLAHGSALHRAARHRHATMTCATPHCSLDTRTRFAFCRALARARTRAAGWGTALAISPHTILRSRAPVYTLHGRTLAAKCCRCKAACWSCASSWRRCAGDAMECFACSLLLCSTQRGSERCAGRHHGARARDLGEEKHLCTALYLMQYKMLPSACSPPARTATHIIHTPHAYSPHAHGHDCARYHVSKYLIIGWFSDDGEGKGVALGCKACMPPKRYAAWTRIE